MPLLVGRYVNKIDKKGRGSVPKPFRDSFKGQGFKGIYAYPLFKYPAIEACGEDFMMRLDSKYLTRHVQRAEEFQGILANRDYADTLKLSLLSLLKTYRADFRQWASARLKFEVELVELR